MYLFISRVLPSKFCTCFFAEIYPVNVVSCFYTPAPRRGRRYTVLPLSILPSVQDIFRRIFLSNYRWQKSNIWSQASYRYPILWEVFLDLSDSYFLFADLVGFYTYLTYMRGYHKWALAHSSSCFSRDLPSKLYTLFFPRDLPSKFSNYFFSRDLPSKFCTCLFPEIYLVNVVLVFFHRFTQ